MPKSSYKKAGLFSSMLVVIGSIIGIGIFIKNSSVFRMNDGNSYAILAAWIIGAVIAILKGYSFLEIASIKKDKKSDNGISLWMSKLVSKKTKTASSFFIIILYLGVLLPILIGYALNFFMMFLKIELDKTILYSTMFLTPVIFFVIRMLSDKVAKKFNFIVTIVKFIPLLIVGLIGIFYIKNGGGIGHNMLLVSSPQNRNLTIGVLISLPSILFSFDAFLNVANISNENDDQAVVSKSIIYGMITVAILYLLITISQININRGYVATLYDTKYDPQGNKYFVELYKSTGNYAYEGIIENVFNNMTNRIFVLLISISAFGVVNIILEAGSNLSKTFVSEEIEKKKGFKNYISYRKHEFIFLLIVLFNTMIIVLAEEYFNNNRTSLVSIGYMNGDFIDTLSNIPVIFAFGFYSLLLIAALINRVTNKVEVVKKKGFVVTSIISIIMTLTIICTFIGYSIIYQTSLDYQSNKILFISSIYYSSIFVVLMIIGVVIDIIKSNKTSEPKSNETIKPKAKEKTKYA